MSALASAPPESLAVEPGEEAVLPVVVRNRGSIVDEFTVRVVGEPEAWADVEPPTIPLFPNAEAVVNVRFRPPRAFTTAPGVVPFAVMISSVEEPEATLVEEGVLAITSFQETTAELAPRTSRGRSRGRHELALDNYGNRPLTATVTGSDGENALQFRLAPATLTALPGRVALAKVEVRARKRLLTGPERMYPFQLQVDAPGTEPIPVEGVFVQRALLPRMLLPIAVVLGGLAVAWALLKPGLESTAEVTSAARDAQRTQEAVRASVAAGRRADEAAKTALGASSAAQSADATAGAATQAAATAQQSASNAQETAASAQETAASAQESASGAGNDATAARAAATQAARSAELASSDRMPGQPTASRLAVNCPPRCVAAVAVPKGEAWLLTDVLFGNPMADRGVVSVARNKEILFVEGLDAFRDLAFRFTAPIVVNEGQRIELSVACDNAPATPEAAPQPGVGPCTPGVFVAGFAQPVPKKPSGAEKKGRPRTHGQQRGATRQPRPSHG